MQIPEERLLCGLLSSLLLTITVAAADESRDIASSRTSPTAAISTTATTTTPASKESANLIAPAELPPLPAGVTELKFSEFFKQPVGSRGLEMTDKARSLDGKRVRILGYMVRQEKPVPHCFLLTPLPVTLNEEEYGFSEDMPATVLHVFTDSSTPATVPFTPGLLLLAGKLTVGNRPESDGRISSVRLQLDPPTEEQCESLQARSMNAQTNGVASQSHHH